MLDTCRERTFESVKVSELVHEGNGYRAAHPTLSDAMTRFKCTEYRWAVSLDPQLNHHPSSQHGPCFVSVVIRNLYVPKTSCNPHSIESRSESLSITRAAIHPSWQPCHPEAEVVEGNLASRLEGASGLPMRAVSGCVVF